MMICLSIAGCNADGTFSPGGNLEQAVNSGAPQQFVNTGFESGNVTGWTKSGTATIVGGAHTGSFAARIGSPTPQKGTSSLVQKITVPSGSPTLSFWYQASDCGVGSGRKQAYLVDGNGRQLATLLDICGPANVWTQKTISLGPWINTAVTLQLIARNDGAVGSTLTVDDIAVSAGCSGQPKTSIYYVNAAQQLVGLVPCAGNANFPYNSCTHDWGFTWTDTDSGQATSVTIEVQEGNTCSGVAPEATRVNGVATGVNYQWTSNNCSCNPDISNPAISSGPQTITLSGAALAAYQTGASNTFMVASGAHCEGPGLSAALNNAFARITVVTPGAGNLLDCDGNPGNGCEVDKTTNVTNCGACGNACQGANNATATCVAAACGFNCNANFGDCDGAPGNGCEVNLNTDTAHCGACNTACSVTNGTPSCTNKVCGVGSCTGSFADCDGQYNTGCEIDTATDPSHCGGCNSPCAVAHGTAGCAASTCEIASCTGAWRDCDHAYGTGCETDTNTDTANCGACNNACGVGQNCTAGQCVNICGGGLNFCGNACFDFQTDNNNCGGCNVACVGGKTCVAGSCDCGEGQSFCAGACIDTTSDSANCGSCNNLCVGGQTCSGGFCDCGGGPSQAFCNGTCTDTNSDNNNCGVCNNPCVGGQTCNVGICDCGGGSQAFCNGACTDTNSDNNNCGGCNNPCFGGQTCISGVCDCGGGSLAFCNAQCTNTDTDNDNCGVCNNPCGGGQTCTGGVCGCNGGLAFCNGQCTDTNSDANHCGACQTACDPGQDCVAGSCTCPGGGLDCGGMCTDTDTDPSNCGGCFVECFAGQSCSAGMCTCDFGQDCGGGICTDTTSDNNNCGVCGTHCTGGQTCSGSTCGCGGGQQFCGGNCTDTSTDAANCGGCGTPCGAAQHCGGGSCDCDDGSLTVCHGTCVDTMSDDANCGGCDQPCGGGGTCVAGVCNT